MTTAVAPETASHRSELPLLAAIVVCISTSGPLVRLAAPAPPLVIAFGRIAIAAAILFALRARPVLSALPATDRRAIGLAVLSGVFLGGHFALWVTSVFETSLVASVVLVATQPLFVSILSAAILREPPTRRLLAGLVLGSLGVLVLALEPNVPGGGHTRTGDLYALAAMVLTGFYVVCGRGARARMPLDLYVSVVYVTAALVVGLVAAIRAVPLLGWPPSSYAAILGSALIPTLGGHTLMNFAVRRMPAPRLSVVYLGEPIGAALLGWLILGSAPGFYEALGGAVLLGGVALALSDRGSLR